MLPKPPQCRGCTLDDRGRGYAPAVGPLHAKVLHVAEALGHDEATLGEPLVGAAGGMYNRLLSRSQLHRGQFRIDNVCRCQPPQNWFDERAPWYHQARQHCVDAYLSKTLAEGHPVVMPMGATALKTLLGIDKGIRVEDWHGTITRDPLDRFWIVPTYHPSHLQRGAHNLFGVVSFDLQQAERVAKEGYVQDDVSLVEDPPVEWFAAWVDLVEQAVHQGGYDVALVEDVETGDTLLGQDEGTLGVEDKSYHITRYNFSVHPDEGVTVPNGGPYIPLVKRLVALKCQHWLWNKDYDDPRILAAGHVFGGDRYDGMWAWHKMQSDLPRGLGFVAPFYCRWGAWKHRAAAEPARYGACDGFKTYRTVGGVLRDLISLGMWDTFARHSHLLYRDALKPAQAIGVKIDRSALTVFIEDLEVKQRRLLHAMQGMVPEACRPLTPKQGYKRQPEAGKVHTKGTAVKRDGTAKKEAPDPIKQELYAQTATIVHRRVRTLAVCCATCGAVEVSKSHRCAAADGVARTPALVSREETVDRWYWQEPFNPDSPDQILHYILQHGHTPGRAKKTGQDSTDRETLTRLAKQTQDPLYATILKSRAVGKVKGTYGVGTLKRLDKDDRVHPTPTDRPSTQRLSYIDPNITNVIADKGAGKDGEEPLAAGFRACVIADQQERPWVPEAYTRWAGTIHNSPAVQRGTRLFEIDFSGIEAVLVGWFCRDADYIRLAKLGVHAGLASHVLERPYDVAWDDARLAAYFKQIKGSDPLLYDRCKRTVHGDNYGLTEYGMVRSFPEIFPTLQIAKRFKRLYRLMAPRVPAWQNALREVAYDLNFLGGPARPTAVSNRVAQLFAENPHLEQHPFGYKHWFWSVLGFRGIPYSAYLKRQKIGEPVANIQGKYMAVTLGEDAKRCVAFFPQSTAAGQLKEVMLRLFDPAADCYIGDAYYGRTPLRAPIHDSLLMEIPNRVWDRVTEIAYREMMRPVPQLSLEWVPTETRTRYGWGTHLAIGVEAKAGLNWKDMTTLKSPTLQELGVSQDGVYLPADESLAYGATGEDDDLADALGTVA